MERKNVDKPSAQNRREFLKASGAITAGLVAQAALPASAASLPALPSNPATPNAMPTRNLGKTGYRVGLFSLGGQAAIERADNAAVAVAIVERALDLGVNYLDTSSIYGGPQRWSERYIGEVMKKRRNEAFLASKTRERTRDGSLANAGRVAASCSTPIISICGSCTMSARSTRWSRFSPRAAPWKRWRRRASRRWCASSASPATFAPSR